jgi:hypothetical protein
MHFHSAGRGPKAGITDMQALAASTITALQHANLVEEAQYVHAHVLARAPEELLERAAVGGQTIWTFKPMVELLLHELRNIATASGVPLSVRREQARWAIEAAGF